MSSDARTCNGTAPSAFFPSISTATVPPDGGAAAWPRHADVRTRRPRRAVPSKDTVTVRSAPSVAHGAAIEDHLAAAGGVDAGLADPAQFERDERPEKLFGLAHIGGDVVVHKKEKFLFLLKFCMFLNK